MKQRLPILLLVLSALLLLGGCAIEPAYRYSSTVDGGGYYSGQSPYGNADTVVYGSYYGSPWGWGPSWGYYGPGWGGVGIGVTYTSHHHRWHRGRRHPPAHRGHWRHTNHSSRHGNHHRSHRSHRSGHHR